MDLVFRMADYSPIESVVSLNPPVRVWLFAPQGVYGLNAQGSSRRNVTRQEGRCRKQQRYRNQSCRIGGLNLEEKAYIKRVSATAPHSPNRTPSRVNLIPSFITRRSTSRCCAPNAIYTPMSCVR